MESSSKSRAGEIASHMFMILVTVANLVLILFLHEYIAWYIIEPAGITRIPLLTDAYFIWLPIPVTASILAIAGYTILIFYDRYWFRTAVQLILNIFGIVIVLSLISIFPFDFSVIPDPTAAALVPMAVTGFFLFMAVVYGVSTLVMSVKLISRVLKRR